MTLRFYRRLSENRVNLNYRNLTMLSLYGSLLLVVVFVLTNLLTTHFIVTGLSMAPTLKNGQLLMVSRASYLYSTPQRGDLVVFKSPVDERDFIKRVIGLPGDLLEFRESQVYINGQRLEEPYVIEMCRANLCSDRIWQIGIDQYFVMGDNRNSSRDSRYFGTISRQDIAGRAIFRYYPFSTVKWLT